MNTLIYERNLPRFAASRLTASFKGSGKGAGIGPLRLTESSPPPLPAADWAHVQPILSGICGSDLATIDGRSSRMFEEIVSFPFVPGHEIVGTTEDGRRVVVEPVLGCRARGITPLCPACEQWRTGECPNIAAGHIHAGLQTGYCKSTGGGWSEAGLVAHASQIHELPSTLTDDAAVTVEPVACGVHAACLAALDEGDLIAVLGAGTLGLTVIASLTHLASTGRLPRPDRLIVGARYPVQVSFAERFGADQVLPPDQLPRALRRKSRSLALGAPSTGPFRPTGGADVVIDCVGSAASLAQALALTRPGGRVVMVGMPGPVRIDLAPLWQRGIHLVGAYAYGAERLSGATQLTRTFDLAIEVAQAQQTGDLVSARYPLTRFEEALAHAGAAGRRGAVKVVFEPTPKKRKGKEKS